MYVSMMMGLPVNYTFDTLKSLLKKYQCGYQCKLEDKENITNAVKKLIVMSISERNSVDMNDQKQFLLFFPYIKRVGTTVFYIDLIYID